ncbi:MAG: molybdate ABC transporter substrate-binding protein [Lachnospiraceae bacterium]|nr:molybdate ABC transporter substrate-binding protein [Lachnospiraceae bacterium]
MKKKVLAVMLTAAMAMSLAACGTAKEEAPAPAKEEAPVEEAKEEEAPAEEEAAPEVEETEADAVNYELVVFAAASMTESLTAVAEKYNEYNPDVNITFTFDSSGTLKTQIEEGAHCDLFISAAPKQMNQLDIEADPEVNTDGLDFVVSESRIDLLENKVTLCVSDTSEAGIDSFDSLAEALKGGNVLLAMGNADVPVGQYTQKIFAFYGIDEEAIQDKLTYGSNVKEVTTAVVEGTADCGIIYKTDAFSAGLTPVDEATSDMCGQVIYPAAVLKESCNVELAYDFLTFLTGPEASAEFEKVGFTPLAAAE